MRDLREEFKRHWKVKLKDYATPENLDEAKKLIEDTIIPTFCKMQELGLTRMYVTFYVQREKEKNKDMSEAVFNTVATYSEWGTNITVSREVLMLAIAEAEKYGIKASVVKSSESHFTLVTAFRFEL